VKWRRDTVTVDLTVKINVNLDDAGWREWIQYEYSTVASALLYAKIWFVNEPGGRSYRACIQLSAPMLIYL
jgi:hypothetical protein